MDTIQRLTMGINLKLLIFVKGSTDLEVNNSPNLDSFFLTSVFPRLLCVGGFFLGLNVKKKQNL